MAGYMKYHHFCWCYKIDHRVPEVEISKLSYNPSVQSFHDNSQSDPIIDFLVEGCGETSDDFTTAADYINTYNEESFYSPETVLHKGQN